MKTALLFLVLLYGVQCSDKIHPIEPGTAGEPKAELMIQRLTLPVQWVGGIFSHEDTKMIGYADVLAATYHQWTRETGQTGQIYLKELVGEKFKFVVPIKNKPNSYLAAADGALRIVTNSSNTYLVSKPVLQLDDPHMQITNGHCDPKGRLFFGTHATCNSVAKLYKVENGEAHVMATAGRCVNDLMWSMDFRLLYVITNGITIWEYTYDMDKGTLGDDPKVVFSMLNHPMLGTAMTSIETDVNGTMWVTVIPEGLVLNIDPKTGEICQGAKIPVGSLTCLTFGGNRNGNLYVGTRKSCPVGRVGEGSVYVVSGLPTYGTYDRGVDWPN